MKAKIKENVNIIILAIVFVSGILFIEYFANRTRTINWKVYDCSISYADGHSESISLYQFKDEKPPKVSSTLFGGSLYILNRHTDGFPRRIYGVTRLTINNVKIIKEISKGNVCNGND